MEDDEETMAGRGSGPSGVDDAILSISIDYGIGWTIYFICSAISTTNKIQLGRQVGAGHAED